jgi:hypothetical protein
LTGTWSTRVHLTDAPPGAPTDFPALDTFLADGGLLVSSAAPSPATRGLAHGAWKQTGRREYTSKFVWFRFDPAGQYVGGNASFAPCACRGTTGPSPRPT